MGGGGGEQIDSNQLKQKKELIYRYVYRCFYDFFRKRNENETLNLGIVIRNLLLETQNSVHETLNEYSELQIEHLFHETF